VQLEGQIKKNLIFIIFYFAWFITSRIITATLELWKVDIDISLCAVLLGTNLFYSINYRTIFMDKGLISVSLVITILIENMILEILRFLLPNTEICKKLIKKFPKISRLLGYKGDDEYMKQKITKSYFIKILSDFWSFLGTVVTIISIKISPNNSIFKDYFDEDYLIIVNKLLIMFMAELLSFSIINIFIRKFYNVSAWKQFTILTTKGKLSLGLICIFWASHVLQDPVIAIISKLDHC